MRAYIIYGFGEGAWHGRKLIGALEARGITLTRNLLEADYVIAHSGGCFDIPSLHDNQLLMMIGPPYWPYRSLASRGLAMVGRMLADIRPSNRPFYRLYEYARHLVSLVASGHSNWRMAQRAQTFNLEKEAKHTNTIIIRNEHDPWITPQLDQLQSLNTHLSLISLPGTHLHCWEYPEPYVDLLEQYKII